MSKKYLKFLPNTNGVDLNEFPYYWITQVHARYVLNIDNVLKKYGLDNSRRRILLALGAKPKASISDLSEMIISKMSTTTKIVYRLKDEGLVNTFSCSEDARITRVELTEKGKDMILKINDITSVVLEQSFEGLTPLQLEKTIDSLKVLYRNLSH
ncbi:MarR family winged helix-turn-helix transcriptional regulator [Acinetobacter ihumii]|uniref:MarR family winged helix-turn-helix transcriptional regulator n=1 Tax=Acinetobacter ihumii TaxID=2483802 RepID=UPI001030E1BE|nr:MarR family winged helix-turn-helix transcriptional regulator [Acinetobacter ihumii]